MGELSAQTLQARGVLGYVVDGGSRDTDLVLAQGFPVFCSFLTPADIVERWVPDRYGEPVTIGSVTDRTGDWLLARPRRRRDHPGRAGRGGRHAHRGGRRHRERDASCADRRHGSGRGVPPVRQVLGQRCAPTFVDAAAPPPARSPRRARSVRCSRCFPHRARTRRRRSPARRARHQRATSSISGSATGTSAHLTASSSAPTTSRVSTAVARCRSNGAATAASPAPASTLTIRRATGGTRPGWTTPAGCCSSTVACRTAGW